MPDSPDYSKLNRDGGRVSLQDMGELAVRLGGMSRLYRTGTTLFMDDFGHGLIHTAAISYSGGGLVSLVSGFSFSSSYQCRLDLAAGGGKLASIRYKIPQTVSSKVAVEFNYVLLNEQCNVEIQFIIYTGLARFIYGLKLIPSSGEIHYYDSTGNYQLLETSPYDLQATNDTRIIKLFVLPSSGIYSSVTINDYEITMSDLDPHNTPTTSSGRMEVFIQTSSSGVVESSLAVSNIIVTEDEP